MLLLFIFSATVVVRYFTAEYIDIGGDNSYTYYFVRHLIETGNFLQSWNQHSIRWAITIPLYTLFRIFGVHPLLYYVLPFLLAGLGSVFVYLIGERLWGRSVGLLAFWMLLIFPQMAQTGSQLWPSIFQFPAAAASIYLIYRWSDTNSPIWLFLSVCTFFFSWGARASGIYFFPGLLWIVWLERKNLRPVLFYALVSAFLFVLETFVLWKLTGNPLGKLGIIKQTHVGTMEALSFLQYLAHIKTLTILKGLLPIYIIAIVTAVFAFRDKNIRGKGLAVFYLIGSFLLLYMVSSIHPLRIAQPHGTRYWCQFAPFGLLLIASQLLRLKNKHKKAAITLISLLLVAFCIFTIKRIPPVNSLTQMEYNNKEAASVLNRNARLRFIWHGWSPSFLESKIISMVKKNKPERVKRGSLRKMRKQAQRIMEMYAPVSIVEKQDYTGFEYEKDGSCIYTPVGVSPEAPIAVDVNFDRRNCFISNRKNK